jgi:predicted outer membrane lipoprotein
MGTPLAFHHLCAFALVPAIAVELTLIGQPTPSLVRSRQLLK